MLKIVKKYIDLSGPENKFLEDKINACKDIQSVLKIFEESGWFISKIMVDTLNKEFEKSEEINAQ